MLTFTTHHTAHFSKSVFLILQPHAYSLSTNKQKVDTISQYHITSILFGTMNILITEQYLLKGRNLFSCIENKTDRKRCNPYHKIYIIILHESYILKRDSVRWICVNILYKNMYKYCVGLSIQIQFLKPTYLPDDQKSKGCAKIKHLLLKYEQNSYL